MDATKRQIYICCHLAIEEGLVEEHEADFPLEKLVLIAMEYGARFGTTKDECRAMLQNPMCEIVS